MSMNPPLSNPMALEGNIRCCEENMPLDMDMETELSVMPDQSDSITCRQSSTSASLDEQQPSAVCMVLYTGSSGFYQSAPFSDCENQIV